MTADEAKLAATVSRTDLSVSDLHRARARELLALAFGVGVSVDESLDLMAARLAVWYP